MSKYCDFVSPSLLERLTENQEKVLRIKSQNVLVNAGAGSGKTTVLTKRVIHLLKDEGYSLDDMIVLTFTDLAAKEMKDRIIKALKNEKDKRLQDELSHIDEANILTFDAFCHKMLVKYNAYSLIDSTFSIGDDALFTMKKKEFIKKKIEEDQIYEYEESYGLIEALKLKEPKNLVDRICEIYTALENEFDPAIAINEQMQKIESGGEFDKIIEKIEDIFKFKINNLLEIELTAIDDKTQKYVDELNDIALNLKNAKNLKEMFIILKQKVSRSPSAPADDEVFRPNKEKFKAILDSMKEILKPFNTYSELEEEYEKLLIYELEILTVMLGTYVEMLQFKKDYNIYSFQDVEVECIRMLKRHPEVCEYYKKHIKEILIDEYQDTNDINSLLISLISNNNELVVGDVKQSIYRFRNANPDIFQDRYYLYKNDNTKGEVIDLDDNFRSREKEVVDVVNDSFVHLSTDKSVNSDFFKNEMKYGLKDYDKFPVDSDNFKIIEIDPDNKDYNEADYIAQDIINRRKNGLLRYDPEKKMMVKAELSDFLVLAYTSSNFDLYKKTFEKYGIPVRVTGDVSFSDSYEVVFIKNALNMVYLLETNSYDDSVFDSSLISLMRSFVLSLKDNMIVKYMMERKNLSPRDAMAKILPKLYEKFLNLVNIHETYGTSKLVNEINTEFKIYESLIRVDDKEAREAKLNILVSQIETYAKSGMDLKSIVEYFDYLKKNKIDTTERITPLNDLACLDMMTIHKSKGLERPFVYICDFKKTLKSSRVNYSKEYGVNFGVEKNVKSILIKLEEKRERNREFFRLLYVALTRARESLTLIFSSKPQDERDIYSFSNLQQFLLYNHSYDSSVYTTIEIKNNKNESKVYTPKEESKPITHIDLNLKEKEVISKSHASHDVVEIDEETQRILEKGTLLHSFFEVTNFLSSDIEVELENKKIADSYKKYLINFSKQSIFNTPSIREFHELPYYLDGSVGIIDYAIEKENEFIIVDFKTSRIDDPAYVNQLSAYKEYISTKTNKPIKTYLYSMLKNVLKEIET